MEPENSENLESFADVFEDYADHRKKHNFTKSSSLNLIV